MQDHQVTWLLPVLNAMPHLRDTLASMADQSWHLHHVIAWDNGSSDGSVEELRRWIPHRLPGRIVTDRPAGLGASLAAMVELADTELCARIDGDDVNEPDRLRAQVELMTGRPEVGVVGTRILRTDDAGEPLDDQPELPTADAEVRWRLRFCNAFAHPTVMFRRSAVLAAGNYRDIKPSQDYDLWTRMVGRCEMANLPERLVRYREHDRSVSAKRERSSAETQRAIAARNAEALWPGVDADEALELRDLLLGRNDRLVRWRDLRLLRCLASTAAVETGKPTGYFRRTPLYRTHRRQLLLDWLKQQPVLGTLDAWRRRPAA